MIYGIKQPLIIVEFVGPDSSRHFDDQLYTQLSELSEQACREFSRDTGSLRLNSKGSATEYMAPVDYH